MSMTTIEVQKKITRAGHGGTGISKGHDFGEHPGRI